MAGPSLLAVPLPRAGEPGNTPIRILRLLLTARGEPLVPQGRVLGPLLFLLLLLWPFPVRRLLLGLLQLPPVHNRTVVQCKAASPEVRRMLRPPAGIRAGRMCAYVCRTLPEKWSPGA